jgi:hypothetical protein
MRWQLVVRFRGYGGRDSVRHDHGHHLGHDHRYDHGHHDRHHHGYDHGYLVGFDRHGHLVGFDRHGHLVGSDHYGHLVGNNRDVVWRYRQLEWGDGRWRHEQRGYGRRGVERR